MDFPRTFPQAVENGVEKAEFYTGSCEALCGIFQKEAVTRNFFAACLKMTLFKCGKGKPKSVHNEIFPMLFHRSLWRLHTDFPPKKASKNSTATAFVSRGGHRSPKFRFFSNRDDFSAHCPHKIPRSVTGKMCVVGCKKACPTTYIFVSTVSTPYTNTTAGILMYSHVSYLVVRRACARNSAQTAVHTECRVNIY